MAAEADRSAPPRFWPQAISNSVWLSADRMVRGAFSLAVLIGIGRFLGPELYGLYSYAIAFVAIFAAFGSLSHDGILIRELIRGNRPPEATLGSAFLLRAVGGLVGMAGAILAAGLLPGARAEAALVGIIAVGLLFQPFDVVDHWFQSRLQSRCAVLVRIGASLLVGSCKIALAWHRAALPALAWMSVAEALLVALGLLAAYRGQPGRPARWRIDRTEIRILFRDSAPMAATTLLVLLFMKLDQIMLAAFLGFRELGVYAAAVRLVDLWNFIPLAVMPSLYPAVVALRKRDEARYGQFLRRLLAVFYLLSLAVVLVNALAGRALLGLLFGPEYVAAAPALALLSVSAVFHYSSYIRAQWMLVEHRVVYHLWSAGIGVAALAGLNAALIPRFGFVGAATATAIGYGISAYGTSLLFRALRPFGRLQTRTFLFQWRHILKDDGAST